jgi:hypothetical protein
VLAQKPLLARYLHLQILLHLLLVALVLEVELLLPGQEVLRSDRGESCELGPLEYLYLFGNDFFLLFGGLTLDQVLVNPVPGLLDDVEYDWFLLTVEDDLIDFLGDGVDVVASDAGNGLNLVLERREGVLLGVFEHDVDLVLELVAAVGLAEDGELEGGSLLQNGEFIEVDMREGSELVLLVPQVLHFSHYQILSDWIDNLK